MGILKELEVCWTWASAVYRKITTESELLINFMVGYGLRIKMIRPVYFGTVTQKTPQL